EDDMSRALAAVRNGDMGVNEAARTYNVTLQRHLAGKNCSTVEHKKNIDNIADLPVEVKNELVAHVLKLEEFMHFIDTVRPSKEREVLLLLDGHPTHTRNLDDLDIAQENGVIMLALPVHTYGLTATIGTAVNGFAKTGVWPVNRDVFQDCHFVAAMQLETDDVSVMEAPTIEPVNEEIPEPNRPNTVIPEKGAIASRSQDSLESLPADTANWHQNCKFPW
ncbi:hypothetical protein ANN_22537, partial [Periplaneta americana]